MTQGIEYGEGGAPAGAPAQRKAFLFERRPADKPGWRVKVIRGADGQIAEMILTPLELGYDAGN